MNLEQIRGSARRTAESHAFYRELYDRFESVYQRALNEPDHPSLQCSPPTPAVPTRNISGLIVLDEEDILKLRQEIPEKSKELTDCIAEGLVPVAYVKIYHHLHAESLEAHTYITYAQTDEDGKIDAESYEDPYYFGKEVVLLEPHDTYPPMFISDDQRRSMHFALDIVDQSARTLN